MDIPSQSSSDSTIIQKRYAMLLMFVLLSLSVSIASDIDQRFISLRRATLLNTYATIANQAVISAGPDNLFIQLDNFRNANMNLGGYATTFYFRSVYVLWPQQVFAGEPSVIINTGDQLLDANFSADDAWLKRHGAAAVLRFVYSPSDDHFHTFARPLGRTNWLQFH